jgi:hypothetical protein
MLKAYDLHTNACIAKPIDFNELIKAIGSIVNFWLEVVALPS